MHGGFGNQGWWWCMCKWHQRLPHHRDLAALELWAWLYWPRAWKATCTYAYILIRFTCYWRRCSSLISLGFKSLASTGNAEDAQTSLQSSSLEVEHHQWLHHELIHLPPGPLILCNIGIRAPWCPEHWYHAASLWETRVGGIVVLHSKYEGVGSNPTTPAIKILY